MSSLVCACIYEFCTCAKYRLIPTPVNDEEDNSSDIWQMYGGGRRDMGIYSISNIAI